MQLALYTAESWYKKSLMLNIVIHVIKRSKMNPRRIHDGPIGSTNEPFRNIADHQYTIQYLKFPCTYIVFK